MLTRFYTDIEQSKKLLSLGLCSETADMYFMETVPNNFVPGICGRLEKDMLLNNAEYYKMTPAWTFTKLMQLMPMLNASEPRLDKTFFASEPKQRYHIEYFPIHNTGDYALPIDAAFEMICYLIENNIIITNKK